MSCKHWNNDWIAHCYGELHAEGERELSRHLEGCSSCRATLEQLDVSRHLLRAGAPELPDAPRVVVLRSAPGRHPVWAFAGGIAAALLLLLAGALAAPGLGIATVPAAHDATAPAVDTVSQAEFRMAIEATERRFEEQLAELRGNAAADPDLLRVNVNRELLMETLADFEDRLASRRANDYEFLMHEIGAAELRTGYRIDNTRQALQFVALASNPRLSEQ